MLFRQSQIDNAILLFRSQFFSEEPKRCSICSACCLFGEVDILDDIWFECQECINKRCSGVLSIEYVLENHFERAESLFETVCRRSNRMPDNLWYWFGKRWYEKYKTLIFPRPSLLQRKGITFHVHVNNRALKSINMLCLCLMRLKIYKDLRQFIVKLIWHPREIISWLK